MWGAARKKSGYNDQPKKRNVVWFFIELTSFTSKLYCQLKTAPFDELIFAKKLAMYRCRKYRDFGYYYPKNCITFPLSFPCENCHFLTVYFSCTASSSIASHFFSFFWNGAAKCTIPNFLFRSSLIKFRIDFIAGGTEFPSGLLLSLKGYLEYFNKDCICLVRLPLLFTHDHFY